MRLNNDIKPAFKKIEYKKIPITPMLKDILEGLTVIPSFDYSWLHVKVKEYMPKHTLYDLRTTFFNRCIECNINENVRDSLMGHCSNNIKQSYTDISNELHLLESNKFQYKLPTILNDKN